MSLASLCPGRDPRVAAQSQLFPEVTGAERGPGPTAPGPQGAGSEDSLPSTWSTVSSLDSP